MSLSKGYTDAIEETGTTLAKYTKPIWAVVKHTPWANDFLGTMFKWGALCGDVPCAIVPKSADPLVALSAIGRIIRQQRQRFPLLKKYLWWACRRYCPDGLSGFQANVATNMAISQLIDDGFVVFTDQARLYTQYAGKYIEKLEEFWPDYLDLDTLPVSAIHVIAAIQRGATGSSREVFLTHEYNIRKYRADKRMNEAYAYRDKEVGPARRWLQQKYPHLDWTQWNGLGIFWDARETLEKVHAYLDRKDSGSEYRKAWKQQQKVNDERLTLWRGWYQTNVALALAT